VELAHGLPGTRLRTLRLAYACTPTPRRALSSSATLGHPVADRNATYVADTRLIHDHKVHLVREDLGTDGTDADGLKRYAEAISGSRAHAARSVTAATPVRQLAEDADRSSARPWLPTTG
jgi:hypothetical protein